MIKKAKLLKNRSLKNILKEQTYIKSFPFFNDRSHLESFLFFFEFSFNERSLLEKTIF